VKSLKILSVGLLLSLVTSSLFAHKHDAFKEVQIKTIPVSNTIYMLRGKGGNIGVIVGNDGVFMIDDQFAPLTGKIKNAVKRISHKPIKYLFNTHWHYDHIGGNKNLGNDGVILVSHDNVRQRLLKGGVIEAFNKKIKPATKAALPLITFNDKMTFHINGETVEIIHKKNAHTDGDAVLYFKKSNVIHTGDIYFNGFYPFIDSSSGGSIEGIINAATDIIKKANTETKIIPGHGKLSNKKELREYRDTLIILRDRMQVLVDKGKTVEEVVAMMPNKDIDRKLGGGFLSPESFLTILYDLVKYP
jgi:glyoxylase-like metal-dependent hydrolase (beta-lactamase superfamily II)